MGKNKDEFVKDITNIEDDFAQWYTDIVIKAELCDYTKVKGFIAYRPYGYAIWENIQQIADKMFKRQGIRNVSMPSLIPESLLNKEKDHVEGFAPEVAWVTKGGQKELEEKLIVRPTSETIFCDMYSKWLNSWRDLPFLYNQWCNVLRWEKETKPILRSREFMWQEGHTIHETAKEAEEFTQKMLDVYATIIEKYLSIPVIKGKKTESEKFAGADSTYTVETMMHDGKALQAGTSHYFGQNFTIPFDIKFTNRNAEQEYAYQTSWGISTRLIGAIIMAHGDNRGLKLPPAVAPTQVIIVPIKQENEEVQKVVKSLYEQLRESDIRVDIDNRDNYTPGYKFNYWEMKGVPVRIEVGPRDIENNQCVITRRDNFEKQVVSLEGINDTIKVLMDEIQVNMFNIVKENMANKTTSARSLEEFKEQMEANQGFIKTMWCGDEECEEKIKAETGAKSRCMPFEQEHIDDKCAICGKPATKMVIWGRQY